MRHKVRRIGEDEHRMSLTELWSKSREQLGEKRFTQVIAFVLLETVCSTYALSVSCRDSVVVLSRP